MEGRLDLVREALATARKNGYVMVDVEANGVVFAGTLSPKAPRRAKPSPQSTDLPAALHVVRAPMVGYYREPSPAVGPGTEVTEETVAAVLTVFGIANDVVAGYAGVVDEVFVTAGQAVEYGQPLLSIREPD